MNVNAVEAFWLGANVIAALATTRNLLDAWRNWRAVTVAWTRFDGAPAGMTQAELQLEIARRRAQEVLARAHVRRELVQLVVVIALLVIVIPALNRPGDTALTPIVAAIMVVPIGIALNSELDRRMRRTLLSLLEAVA